MLELIVLGQVPGTSIQLTFKIVIAIALVLIVSGMVRSLEQRHARNRALRQLWASTGATGLEVSGQTSAA